MLIDTMPVFNGTAEIVVNNTTQGMSAEGMCSYYEVDKGHHKSKLQAENVWRMAFYQY